MPQTVSPLFTAQRALVGHQLVDQLTTLPRWRIFMQHHVFCVWDFMSLLKRLQRDHTCLDIPWRPAPQADLARLVNEMVMEEESDRDQDGEATSHLELYLRAMTEADADRKPIDSILAHIKSGTSWRHAIRAPEVSPLVTGFVEQTLTIATEGSAHEVAASFFYGREQMLPSMFEQLVAQSRNHPSLRTLTYYFERHIELDGGSHSLLAQQLVNKTIGSDPKKKREAEDAAAASLAARAHLWSALVEAMRHLSS